MNFTDRLDIISKRWHICFGKQYGSCVSQFLDNLCVKLDEFKNRTFGTLFSIDFEPHDVFQPFVAIQSLIANGTPLNTPFLIFSTSSLRFGFTEMIPLTNSSRLILFINPSMIFKPSFRV